jgi:hypothetical protein
LPKIRFVFEVCVVASNYPEEGRSAGDGADEHAKLPFRAGGANRPAHTEARAELRDRETYYTELLFAVHCQSRSIPAPRVALDDAGSDTWTASANEQASANGETNGTDGESWDEMVARFGDTWT